MKYRRVWGRLLLSPAVKSPINVSTSSAVSLPGPPHLESSEAPTLCRESPPEDSHCGVKAKATVGGGGNRGRAVSGV